MRVKKAVITAAGRGVGLYPAVDTVHRCMYPLVDRDGLSKPVIQIIAEEALECGIEEVCIVCAPGDEKRYVSHLESLRDSLVKVYGGAEWAHEQADRLNDLCSRLRFVVQEEPLGYGHAVYCARDFVGPSPFLLLLDDHLYISDVSEASCAQQVMRMAIEQECAIAAVHPTREHLVGQYGTVSGKQLPDLPGTYQIEKILEKPSLSLAEMELHTPGLRVGHYLCFLGMHVLPHTVFDILGETIGSGNRPDEQIQLTPALDELARREKYLALDVKGSRYDIGAKFGLLKAEIAFAMDGSNQDEVLGAIVELLAESHGRRYRGTDG